MGRIGGLRRTLLLCVLVSLLLPLLALPATAEEAVVSPGPPDTSFEGLYPVSGSTSTGFAFGATVIVKAIGADIIQFDAEYDGIPLSTYGPATWSGADEVSVPLSVTVPFLASGSGTVVLTRAEGGWNLFASGSGSVLGKSGSATASGFGGGVPPTRAEVAGVTRVSETVLAVDEVLAPLAPAAEEPSVTTEDTFAVLAFVLFLVFIWILFDLILGAPFFSGA